MTPPSQAEPINFKCIKCGAEITPPAKFCPDCGASQSAKAASDEPIKCAACGFEIPKDASFCSECGTSQSSQPQTPQMNAHQGGVTPLPDGSSAAIGGTTLKRNVDSSGSSQPSVVKVMPKGRRIPLPLLISGVLSGVVILFR